MADCNMTKIVKLPAALYERLFKHIKSFDDTPASVIEWLLDEYEGVEPSLPASSAPYGAPHFGAKDTTRYTFNGRSYGKGRLVLAVVHKYVEDHPNAAYEDMLNAFPKHLQGSTGVVNLLAFVREKYYGKRSQRHYMKHAEVIHLSGSDAVVCTEWGISNIDNFIEAARTLGYEVTA